jgi:predicted phage gp36 major capsid-like protein
MAFAASPCCAIPTPPSMLFYMTIRVSDGVQDFDAIKVMKFAAI